MFATVVVVNSGSQNKAMRCLCGWNEGQQQAIMGLAGLLLLQIILLESVAAVAATLSQVTGPLSLKPVVTRALLAQVWP